MRRSLNTTERLETSARLEVIETFLTKMWRSGYGLDERREIMECGLKKYERIRRKVAESGGDLSLHRSAKSTQSTRYVKKLLLKQKWMIPKAKNVDDRGTLETTGSNQAKYTSSSNIKAFVARNTRRDDANTAPSAVFFVERTRGGELLMNLRKEEINS